MKAVSMLVAFHTVDWIRVAVTSYLEAFPEDRLLVVDNNPRPGEPGWRIECDRERLWLAAHPAVDLVENRARPDLQDGRRTHGSGIDAALAWCRKRGVDVLVHFEPDCLITGRQWRQNLLDAIAQGAWMAGTHRKVYGVIHPTASAWRVDKVQASFRPTPRAADVRNTRFGELVDLEPLRTETEPKGAWFWCERNWDTAEKAWFEAALEGRTALVGEEGFHHYWLGSTDRRKPQEELVAQFPELAEWFASAPVDAAPRRVEDCAYRSRVQQRNGSEVATCGLLRELTGVHEEQACAVEREVCEACVASIAPSPGHINPVVASHMFDMCESIIESGGVPGCDSANALRLQEWAERNLALELPAAEAPVPMLTRGAGPCCHFGDEVGIRVMLSATGYSRLPVYACNHPAHRETTLAACQSCRDWAERPRPEPQPIEALLPPPALRHGPLVRRWAVGVTTAPRAQPTLAGCLDNLARAGWTEPRLFVDSSATIPGRYAHLPITHREMKLGAWANYYLSLVELLMREPEADAYMLVQDDALFDDRHDLRMHLERILWPADPIAAVSLYCPSGYTRAEPGWSAVDSAWEWGALAFVFPRESAKRFVADREVLDHRGDPNTGHAHIDDVIGLWARRIGWPIHYPTPSLVQHTGDTSAIWPGARAIGLRRADRFVGDAASGQE